MSEPTGTDWSLPALVAAIGTATGAAITAASAYMIGNRKQSAAECKEDDDRADRISAATIERYERRMEKLEQHNQECQDAHAECEKRQARTEERVAWLERQISGA
jgi:exonuclease VII large subunit